MPRLRPYIRWLPATFLLLKSQYSQYVIVRSFAMSLIRNSEKVLLNSAAVLVLASLLIGFATAQNKKNPPAPRPSAPHTSAPHANAPASRPSGPRPSTSTHSPTGARPGIAGANRAGTPGRTGTGPAGRAGTGMGKTGNGTVGRNGARPMGPAGKTGGMTGARGGTGTVGRTVSRQPAGRQVSLRGGGSANIRPNGQIRSINRNGMHIDRGLNGSRRIESTRNGARIVTTGRHSGYVQRPYVTRNGRSYVSRTVVVNNVSYTSVYRSYSYGGYCCY
jgi:hypothetical protein